MFKLSPTIFTFRKGLKAIGLAINDMPSWSFLHMVLCIGCAAIGYFHVVSFGATIPIVSFIAAVIALSYGVLGLFWTFWDIIAKLIVAYKMLGTAKEKRKQKAEK